MTDTSETFFGDVADESIWTDTPTDSEEVRPDSPTEEEEVRPTPVKGRVETTEIVTLIWSGIGTMAIKTNIDAPVGRMMQMQAPLAGTKIDNLIAGTFIDALLQPLARRGDSMADVGAIILGPVLVGLLERNPDSIPMVEPILREVVYTSLVEMAPVLRKKKADQRRAARAMADVNEAFDLPPGADPFESIMSYVFTGGNESKAEEDGTGN